MRIWIDIENPPQVQYLVPFRDAFERAGAEVVITARDYGMTYDLLTNEGVDFHPIGTAFGRERWRKALGLARRAHSLSRLFRRLGRPDALITAGRASAVVARRLRIPAFVLTDYEHTNHSVGRLTRSYIVFPDAIDAVSFRECGIRPDRLLSYAGLKEDITFAGIDVDAASPFTLDAPDDLVRVLFRPPAEESHYYSPESGEVSLALLEHLSRREEAVLVLSPRYARQAAYLDRFEWANPPVVLDRAIPFLSLLKAVDVVISSGGTMVREAAYLGVPAYSVLRNAPGGVDRRLESLGRLRFITSPEDFGELTLRKGSRQPVLASNPQLLDELRDQMLERIEAKARRGSSQTGVEARPAAD
jgi:uncharacterized protein